MPEAVKGDLVERLRAWDEHELREAVACNFKDYVNGPTIRGAANEIVRLRAALSRAEAALAGMLTVEPQDRGHVHTIGMTANAREALGIPADMPIGLWQARQANRLSRTSLVEKPDVG